MLGESLGYYFYYIITITIILVISIFTANTILTLSALSPDGLLLGHLLCYDHVTFKVSSKTLVSKIKLGGVQVPDSLSMWVAVKIMAPFLGTLNIRCRLKMAIQKGTIILTTTHIQFPHSFPVGSPLIPLKPLTSHIEDCLGYPTPLIV